MNATTRRPLIALAVVAAVASVLLIAGAPTAEANSSSASVSAPVSATVSVPRCYEDQVIARHGRCLQRDDRTTRFHRVTASGRGYWYDTRYPSALRVKPVVRACKTFQMVERGGGCVLISQGDFRGYRGPLGWWYYR